MATEHSGASSCSPSEWDVEKLRKELRKHTGIRDGLLRTTGQMQQAASGLETMISNVPNEDNIWWERYLQQRNHNQQLEAQLAQLERKLEGLRSQHKEVVEQDALHTYDGMSDVGLRQLLRRLEKEKAEVGWQLRDCEWRLDQEAAAVYKAEEEKKAILTELGQASLQLEEVRKKREQLQVAKQEERSTKSRTCKPKGRKT